MARFRYALQPALDVAFARERDALGAFGRARGVRARSRAALEEVSAHERDLRALAATLTREQRAAAALLDAEACREALARQARGRLALLVRAEDAVAAAHAGLACAVQRRTALERHRAKVYAAWEARGELREAGELDDANAIAQARSGSVRKYVA
jgi:hypothetical protein